MDDFRADIVQKVPVVGDYEQCSRIALKPVLQPHDRIQIQMVGGFIQKKEIRGTEKSLGQIEPHPPAAGEVLYGFLKIFHGESETQKQGSGSGVYGVGTGFLEFFLKGRETHAVVGIRGGLYFLFQLPVFFIAVQHIIEGALIQTGGFLGNCGYGPVPGY